MSFVATLTDCKGGVCDKCNKVFYKKENLFVSQKGYTTAGNKPVTSVIPPVKLKSAQALTDHNRSHHSGEQTCNQCNPPVKLKSAKALGVSQKAIPQRGNKPVTSVIRR